jgi:hypothetical protein
MYQSGFGAGAGSLVSFGLVEPLPDTGSLWWFARLVLDAAGALFAAYLLCCLGLALGAVAVRFLAAAGRRSQPGGYL